MLLLAKFIANIFSVLNSEEAPAQIAAGFAFGALLGLLPIGILATLLGLLAFLVNINLTMMGVAAILFKFVSFLLDPVADKVGYFLLVKVGPLQGFWTRLYNTPLVPYTRFNNTLVMGSLAIGILLLVPMYFVGSWGVNRYREKWQPWVERLRIVQTLKASNIYKYYLMYKGARGQ